MDKWIAYRTQTGQVTLSPANIMDENVAAGSLVQILLFGIDPLKMANTLAANGVVFEQKYVTAHRAGKSRLGRPKRPIQCVQTGHVYKSISEASTATGIASGNLSNHLRHPEMFKSVGGYQFKYYEGV